MFFSLKKGKNGAFSVFFDVFLAFLIVFTVLNRQKHVGERVKLSGTSKR